MTKCFDINFYTSKETFGLENEKINKIFMNAFSNFSICYLLILSADMLFHHLHSRHLASFLLKVYGSESVVQANRKIGISETNLIFVGLVGETFIASHPTHNY
jgi:hypothetical protein